MYYYFLQIAKTTDKEFELKWNMTDMTVKVYNVDARRMNNIIPRQNYGTSLPTFFFCITHYTR